LSPAGALLAGDPAGPCPAGAGAPAVGGSVTAAPNELGLVAAPPGLGAAEIAAAAFSGAAGVAPSFVPATATNSGCLSKSFVVVQAQRVINNAANATKEGLVFTLTFLPRCLGFERSSRISQGGCSSIAVRPVGPATRCRSRVSAWSSSVPLLRQAPPQPNPLASFAQ